MSAWLPRFFSPDSVPAPEPEREPRFSPAEVHIEFRFREGINPSSEWESLHSMVQHQLWDRSKFYVTFLHGNERGRILLIINADERISTYQAHYRAWEQEAAAWFARIGLIPASFQIKPSLTPSSFLSKNYEPLMQAVQETTGLQQPSTDEE